jgi:hypothetical protein
MMRFKMVILKIYSGCERIKIRVKKEINFLKKTAIKIRAE